MLIHQLHRCKNASKSMCCITVVFSDTTLLGIFLSFSRCIILYVRSNSVLFGSSFHTWLFHRSVASNTSALLLHRYQIVLTVKTEDDQNTEIASPCINVGRFWDRSCMCFLHCLECHSQALSSGCQRRCKTDLYISHTARCTYCFFPNLPVFKLSLPGA